MKLYSKYLNPFKPFRERESDSRREACIGATYENNMSRSVFSALGNSQDPRALAIFLEALAHCGSPKVRERTLAVAESLRVANSDMFEWRLQGWPNAAIRERAQSRLLIGISCSHSRAWIHNGAPAPKRCCPDASIHVPGKTLLVFECKNDDHPLDATQMSAYAHELKLVTEDDNVPRAKPGATLASRDEARKVQTACRDIVLDVPWNEVVEALEKINQSDCVDSRGRWLCGSAAAYLDRHVYPPYEGVATILKWLKRRDIPRRRRHLRRLVQEMGKALAQSPQGSGAITFVQTKREASELPSGGGSAVYVKLQRDGKPLRRHWLGKDVDAVLWFDFADDEGPERIGLSFYLQASGCDARGKSKASFNKASLRHSRRAEPFEEEFAKWAYQAPDSSLVIVGAVGFKGECRMFHGGGAPKGPNSLAVPPKEALEFLNKHRAELWRFPRLRPGEEPATVKEAAKQVRKPALSLQIVFGASELVGCGMDGQALQDVLRKGIGRISAES